MGSDVRGTVLVVLYLVTMLLGCALYELGRQTPDRPDRWFLRLAGLTVITAAVIGTIEVVANG